MTSPVHPDPERLAEDVDQDIVRLVGIPGGWRVRKVALAEVVALVAKQHDAVTKLTTEELDAVLRRGIYIHSYTNLDTTIYLSPYVLTRIHG